MLIFAGRTMCFPSFPHALPALSNSLNIESSKCHVSRLATHIRHPPSLNFPLPSQHPCLPHPSHPHFTYHHKTIPHLFRTPLCYLLPISKTTPLAHTPHAALPRTRATTNPNPNVCHNPCFMFHVSLKIRGSTSTPSTSLC